MRRGMSADRRAPRKDFARCALSVAHCEPELLDAVPNLIAVEAEQGGGLRLVPSRTFESLNDQTAFEGFELDALCGKLEICAGSDCRGQRREVLGLEPLRIRKQHRALDDIAQLAHVARPAVALECGVGRRTGALHALAELGVEP